MSERLIDTANMNENHPQSSTPRLHEYIPEGAERELDDRFNNTVRAGVGPIVRFDRKVAGTGEEVGAAVENFKTKFETATGIHPGLLDANEIFYLNRLFERSDDGFVNNFKAFFADYSLAAVKFAIATEYHPSILNQYMNLEEQANVKKEEILDILQLFNVIYDVIEGIQKVILEKIGEGEGYDELAQQTFEALLRKAVDLTELWLKIHTFDNEVSKYSAKSVRSAIKSYFKSLFLIQEFFDEDPSCTIEKLSTPEGQMPKYRITDISGIQYGLKFFVRPRAINDGQARVNLEIDFDTENPDPEARACFMQTTARKKSGKVEKESVFRLSLDRDTTHPDVPALSLDIGRSKYHGNTFDRTGDDLGNMLAEVSGDKNHTPYSFDPQFAKEDKFASIAEAFSQYISDLHATESQTEHQM